MTTLSCCRVARWSTDKSDCGNEGVFPCPTASAQYHTTQLQSLFLLDVSALYYHLKQAPNASSLRHRLVTWIHHAYLTLRVCAVPRYTCLKAMAGKGEYTSHRRHTRCTRFGADIALGMTSRAVMHASSLAKGISLHRGTDSQ